MTKNDQIKLEELEYLPLEFPENFPVRKPTLNIKIDSVYYPPHVHEGLELGYCYEGRGVFIVGSKAFECGPGDAVVISGKEHHVYKAASGNTAKWKFMMIKPMELLMKTLSISDMGELRLDSFEGENFMNLFKESDNPGISLLIKDIINEHEQENTGYISAIRAQIWLLMIKLQRFIPDDSLKSSCTEFETKKILPALKRIALRYQEELQIEILAKICNSSVTNFRRIFRKATGMSPNQYITFFRIKIAQTMLINTDHKINQIAIESGFPTLSNFNRHFNILTGISPSAYREKFNTKKHP